MPRGEREKAWGRGIPPPLPGSCGRERFGEDPVSSPGPCRFEGPQFASQFLIAQATDDSDILDDVRPALGVGDDVVCFGAIRLPGPGVV